MRSIRMSNTEWEADDIPRKAMIRKARAQWERDIDKVSRERDAAHAGLNRMADAYIEMTKILQRAECQRSLERDAARAEADALAEALDEMRHDYHALGSVHGHWGTPNT